MWRFIWISALCLVIGCSKLSSSDLAKQIIAQTGLSDSEAVQKIAEIYFPEDAVTTKQLKDGKVHLTVVTKPNKSAETKVYGTGKAKDSHQFSALFSPLLDSRGVIEQARQRKLGRFTIKIRESALGPENQPVDFDLFGFTVEEAQFDQFLNVARIDNVMRGDTRGKIKTVSKIDFDNFDQLTFSHKH